MPKGLHGEKRPALAALAVRSAILYGILGLATPAMAQEVQWRFMDRKDDFTDKMDHLAVTEYHIADSVNYVQTAIICTGKK